MNKTTSGQPVNILLVEDSPGDVDLTIEALEEGKIRNQLTIVEDGVQAMAYLLKKDKYKDAVTPDLILLDLNLPKKNGREVLSEIKSDPTLKRIPTVILTTSKSETDILQSYDLHANCYITKHVDFEKFTEIIKMIENFWFTIVRLPALNE